MRQILCFIAVLELQRNNTRRKSKQKNRVVGPSAALDCKVNSAVIPSEVTL